MGLSQSLYTGYSGLVTHQRALDNTSNNLANVNTVGYKGSTFMFSNLMKQAIAGAVPGDGETGSTNPKNIGFGVTTGAIATNFTQGSVDVTNNTFDCYISGNGFYVVKTATGDTALTRNGSFWLDNFESSGNRMLVVGDGLPVQGWMAANGAVTPTTTASNIYLPAEGDMLAGQSTSSVTLTGVLPTDTSTSDFNGARTTTLQLSGNLSASGQSISTSIYASATTTDADGNQTNEITEIPVVIQFFGPTASSDGAANQWTWTMSTADGVQIYPTEDDPAFSQGILNFHATTSNAQGFGAGQSVANTISPGASSTVTTTDADGNTVSFSIASSLTIDVSRLTNMADAPTDNDDPGVWYVDGNPTGTMRRTVTTWDEYTDFVSDGNGNITAERRVAERQASIILEQTDQDSTGTTWSWSSSLDGAEGTLRFNTVGDLVSSNQTGGDVDFQWRDVVYTAMDGALTLSSQDGYRDGYLFDFAIDDDGVIWGTYDNNVNVALAQIALGTVSNIHGLTSGSGTLFYANSASGGITIGVANDSAAGVPSLGLGSIVSGALENSNVDMSREFTTMIAIERGYQFNSRIVTTANEMLQTALQMKQ